MDALYLDGAPDGVQQMPYEADLGFRLPMTTTPVAEVGINVPPGLNITNIDILQVQGLPPGLFWEASQTSFSVQEETDGCVRFCGTPLQADSFVVEVIVEASLGVLFSQEASLFIPMYIAPATVTNEGFSLVNNLGCGEVTTSFVNNVPSNGNPGFSYLWDFGDGSFSNAEDPTPMTYTQPGIYPVTYQAVIDTTGFFLTNVTVLETSCDDAFGGLPDLKINVFAPNGDPIYTSPIVENADVPTSFTTFIALEEGNYSVQVIDDDNGLGGADDDCGTIAFSRQLDGTFVAGDLTLSLTIFHPVDTITTVDTVRVFEQPDAPQFAALSNPLICPEDSVTLSVLNFIDGLAWLQDSNALDLPDTRVMYTTSQPGLYTVVYTSPDGCQSMANAPVFDLIDPPITVTLENFGNVVQVFNNEIPLQLTYSWELDGFPIDETELRFCATESGRYTLVLTDVQTGCTSRSTIDVTVDPEIACDVTAVIEQENVAGWQVFPNPSTGPLNLSADLLEGGLVQLRLVDIAGRAVWASRYETTPGFWQNNLELPNLAPGSYFLQITTTTEAVVLPILRQ